MIPLERRRNEPQVRRKSLGDYYQGIVVDYLRADRSIFINPECCIQIKSGPHPPKGTLWYCDALAVDFGIKPDDPSTIFLCEVTYSRTPQALIKRLREWNSNWEQIRKALAEYNGPPLEWESRPWLFVPEANDSAKKLVQALKEIDKIHQLSFRPRITTLEKVVPWAFSEDRNNKEAPKPDCIPLEWRS
jgi:hypothetical protein